jgi:hypothetical protein
MSIFKNISKSLKKAAPLIGAGIGFYFGGGAGLGTALGAGIGTLAGGGDIEDALMAGALGYGAGSLAQGYLPSAGQAATKGIFGPTGMFAPAPAAGTQAVTKTAGTQVVSPGLADVGVGSDVTITDLTKDTSFLGSIGDFVSDNKLLTAGVGATALGLLASGEEEEVATPYRETRAGRPYQQKVVGPITQTVYNLANEDEVESYNEELLQLREKSFKYEAGGEVNGPGTGTSDSVPARLSDGEFVLTARAVRGAGNGDRDIGAARMYDMMAELESMA